jgi:hypothetical protein
MPQGTEAPAGTMAEGQTSHTQNQPARLTAPQLRLLHRAVDPKRVGKDDKGFAHMEAWDIKRYLLRVFGFAGYDTENRELALVREIEIPGQGQNARSRWTVVYRAQVRLTVKDVHGRELGHWDGEAAGGASNQPKLDDAHDMAMKTASSQALKRAATNLGDQFGLSLYNNGSPAAVVGFCAAHPPAEWEKTAEAVPEPNDPPVQPEPAVAAAKQAPEEPVAAPQTADHLARLRAEALECWAPSHQNSLALGRIILDAEKHGVADADVELRDGRVVMFRELLNGRIAEMERILEQGGGEQRAA